MTELKPTRIIFKTYLVSFLLLFLLLTAYQALFIFEFQNNTNHAQDISIAGRQRMLSQRIGKNLSLLTHQKNPSEYKQLLKKISKDSDDLYINHEILQKNISHNAWWQRENIKESENYVLLSRYISEMMSVVTVFKTYSFSIGSRYFPTELDKALIRYLANDEAFVNLMEKIVKSHETELQTYINRLNTIALGGAGFILLIMLVNGRYAVYKSLKFIDSLFTKGEQHKNSLEFILNSSQDGIICIDASTRISYFNHTAEAIFGLHFNEVSGEKITNLIPSFYSFKKEKSDEMGCCSHATISAFSKERGEFPIALKKCKSYEYEAYEFIVFVKDMSEQIQAKCALEKSEAQYRAVVEDQVELICRYDANFILTFVNNAYCTFFKKSKEELIGHHIGEFFSDEIKNWFKKTHSALTVDSPFSTNENSYVTDDRKTEWMFWKTRALFSENAELIEYQGVGIIITRRKEAEFESIRARKIAEEANKAKSKFLSNMSHEFRTPLNAILGFAQLLEVNDDNPLTLEQQDSIKHILKSGEDLLTLINRILDLSRLEIEQFELNMKAVDICGIVNHAFKSMMPFANAKNIQMNYQNSEERCCIYADKLRVKQVVLHLISNAIKYNNAGGQVEVIVEKLQKRIKISVRDNGLGISKHRLDELFKPFSRLGFDCSGIEGAGIGLSISKHLVEKMDGEIAVNSKENEGSCFWISFPILNHAEMDNSSPVTMRANTKPLKAISEADSYKVLYIEEDSDNTVLVSTILKRRLPHFVFLEAANTETGLKLIQQHKPAIVLIDIEFPEMTGFDTIAAIKKHFDHPMIIIAFGADVMSTNIKQVLDAGFFTYLPKPINILNFQRVLIDALKTLEG